MRCAEMAGPESMKKFVSTAGTKRKDPMSNAALQAAVPPQTRNKMRKLSDCTAQKCGSSFLFDQSANK